MIGVEKSRLRAEGKNKRGRKQGLRDVCPHFEAAFDVIPLTLAVEGPWCSIPGTLQRVPCSGSFEIKTETCGDVSLQRASVEGHPCFSLTTVVSKSRATRHSLSRGGCQGISL